MSGPDTCVPWVEIDHQAIAWNVRALRRRLSPSARLLVAVKADAYGHGAEEVARTVLRHGADMLGVVRFAEAQALRQAGIVAPILIFGPSPAVAAADLLALDLTPTLTSAAEAAALSARLPERRRLGVHVKIDTGMGRMGFCAQQLDQRGLSAIVDEITAIDRMPGIVIAGTYTHFASADAVDGVQTRRQFALFSQVLQALRDRGVETGVRHAANSAGLIRHPHMHLDMARSGIAVYGLSPGHGCERTFAVRPALALKTRIVQLKECPPGTTVGYGESYRATQTVRIATVPLGYGDGYDRAHGAGGSMLIRGRRAPIIGRVCMDFTMLDVSAIADAAPGDEVVAYGRQGALEIPIDEAASRLGTIGYEVACTIAARVPRIHLREQHTRAAPLDAELHEPALSSS
jgi:alanine racemase